MKKILLIVCALGCMALIACKDNFKIVKRDFSFNSDKVGTRTVRLVVPIEETTDRYPTIYLLHGAGSSDADLDNIAGTAKYFMEDLYRKHDIGRMIVVIPNAMTVFRRKPSGSFYTDSPVTGEFKTYITPELVDSIDANFRTKKDRSQRALTGESMGGYGAIILALQSPGNELFSSTASHSGLLCFDEMLPLLADPPEGPYGAIADYVQCRFVPLLNAIFSPGLDLDPRIEDDAIKYNETAWQQWLEHDPYSCLNKDPTAFDDFDVYVDCGASDELGLAEHAKKFAKMLDSLGVQHQFLIYEYQTGTDWLDRWLSGHSFLKWRFGESLKFHWNHFSRK